MPIYDVAIKGRRARVMLAADNATEAKNLIVEVRALNAAETQQAFIDGEKLWNPAEDRLPDDSPEPEGGDKNETTQDEAAQAAE